MNYAAGSGTPRLHRPERGLKIKLFALSGVPSTLDYYL